MGGELILLNSSLLLGYEMGCWGGGRGGRGRGGYCFLCCSKWVHFVASVDEILKYCRHKSYCAVLS